MVCELLFGCSLTGWDAPKRINYYIILMNAATQQ